VTKARAASARSRPLGPGPSDLALGGQLAAPALHCTCTASGGHGASERGGAPGARSIKGAAPPRHLRTAERQAHRAIERARAVPNKDHPPTHYQPRFLSVSPPLARGGRRGSEGGKRGLGGATRRRRPAGLGMRGVTHAAPTGSAPCPLRGRLVMDGLLIFVFYLSLPIRGGRDHSLISNC
jgi:hypothetical protein